MKPEQAPKGLMGVSSFRMHSEDRRDGSEKPTRADLSAPRGIGRSTCAHIDGQHGRPAGVPRGNGDFGLRRGQESEEAIVPSRPVNAGGGKGLWFEVRPDETRVRRLA